MMEMTIEVAKEVDANTIDAGVAEGGGDRVGGTTVKRKKLRWSKVAFQDVVLKSMPLACDNSNRSTTDDDAKSAEQRNEVLREVAELRIELGHEDRTWP